MFVVGSIPGAGWLVASVLNFSASANLVGLSMFLPQLHGFETSVYIRRFDHGGVVEEEVVVREAPVAKGNESFAVNTEDLHGNAA